MLNLSFTILQWWQKGEYDKAIRALMGDWDTTKTKEMVQGIRLHEAISEKKMKPFVWMDGGRYEKYIRIPINDEISFGGYIDWSDGETIIDWKSGQTQSNQQNKLQLFCYSLLVPSAIQGVFAHIDNDCQVLDYSIYKLGEIQRELALNYIETIAGEIMESF